MSPSTSAGSIAAWSAGSTRRAVSANPARTAYAARFSGPARPSRRRTDRGDHSHRQVTTGRRGDARAEAQRLTDHHRAEVPRRGENHHTAGCLVAPELTKIGAEQQPTVAYRPRAFGGRDGHLDGGAECRGDRVVRDCVGAQRDRESEARRRRRQRRAAPMPTARSRGRSRRDAPQQPPRRACRQADAPKDGADRPDDSRRGHDPTGQRRRDQARIQPLRGRTRRWTLRHQPQTRTSGRSFSRRPGPMPSTSPSWSTLVNLPWASRHATIAAAITGPTPGRVSNCCTVAVFRLTGCAGPPLAGRDARTGRAGSGRAWAHRTAQHRGLSFDRRDAHHDLLAVVDLAGHVEPDGVGAVRRAAGGLQRVGDPRARAPA